MVFSDSGDPQCSPYVWGSKEQTGSPELTGAWGGEGVMLVDCRLHSGLLPGCFFEEALMSLLVFLYWAGQVPQRSILQALCCQTLKPGYGRRRSQQSVCKYLLWHAPVFNMVLLLQLYLVPLVQTSCLLPFPGNNPHPHNFIRYSGWLPDSTE